MNTTRQAVARLFFALWPAPEVRDALAAIARGLQAKCGGRPTRADRIHLTLFFVGQVARERLVELESVAVKIQHVEKRRIIRARSGHHVRLREHLEAADQPHHEVVKDQWAEHGKGHIPESPHRPGAVDRRGFVK